MVPKQISRYKIVKLIGETGMSQVFLAHDHQFDRHVALKTMTLPAGSDNEQRDQWGQRFKREAKAAGRLTHPAIVTMYDVDLEDNPPYVVMEYLAGPTLKAYFQQGALPWSDALKLLRPIIQALAYAHRVGIIHRDVKPDNIMFADEVTFPRSAKGVIKLAAPPEGGLKLLDFGLARLQEADTQVTQPGTTFGTPGYMSPEQARGEPVDGRTDLFAVGIILLEAITGQNPLVKESVIATLSETISPTPIDLSSLDNLIPLAGIQLLERTVAKDRKQRYHTSEALLADLDLCLGLTQGQGTDGNEPSSVPLPPNKPPIQVAANITLEAEEEAVLRAMFNQYDRLTIEAEFGQGLSDSRVLRVRPGYADGRAEFPWVVKVASLGLVSQEVAAYQIYVKQRLPEVPALKYDHTLPLNSLLDGLCYELVGQGAFKVESLMSYYPEATAEALRWILADRVYSIIGYHWWQDNRLFQGFQMQMDYDPILPVNLHLRSDLADPQNVAVRITPDDLPSAPLKPGTVVTVAGFIITEIDAAASQVTLNLPSRPEEQSSSSYRLRLVDLSNPESYQVGQIIDHLTAQVTATRHDLLLTQAQKALGNTFNLTAEILPLPAIVFKKNILNAGIARFLLRMTQHLQKHFLKSYMASFSNVPTTLPNPLQAYQAMLLTFLDVKIATIHGDLNLENILINPETRALNLIDFATVRQGHVLHDLLRLETETVTKLVSRALHNANLPPTTIYLLYQAVHQATDQPDAVLPANLPSVLENPFVMLTAIRKMARVLMLDLKDWTEYYQGLTLYLLGALKFKNLDRESIAPLPKQTAFWAAATAVAFWRDSAGCPPEYPPAIFIAYENNVKPDEAVTSAVHTALEKKTNYPIFVGHGTSGGKVWARQTEAELSQSIYLIVFLSARSVASEALAELLGAVNRLDTPPTILPVRLNYLTPFPYPLSKYLDHLNWAYWEDDEDTPDLIKTLEQACAGEPLPIDKEIKADFLQANQPSCLGNLAQSSDIQSPCYIERENDHIALEAIKNQGVTITIKGPWRIGKSELLNRITNAADEVGKRVIQIDCSLFDISESDTFFRQFCFELTQELGKKVPIDKIDALWEKPLSNSNRCRHYVGNYLLKSEDVHLVLAIDKLDTIFKAGFHNDFFGMLRAWHERRARDLTWKKLDLVLVTSTEPYLFIDSNQSPFNVGEEITLKDFSPEQVFDLNCRHGSPLDADQEEQLITLLNGHPFLTHQALYWVSSSRYTFDDILSLTPYWGGPFADHFRALLWRLKDQEGQALLQGLRQVINENSYADDKIISLLEGAGLVRKEQQDRVVPRCQLYESFFQEYFDD